MKTEFSKEQLSVPFIARSEGILRSCVHCGMCTATCPSYQVLGNELDSPRGRIYLIKSMLEEGRKPDAKFVKHIDQCLSCLACTTTCPSGVDYMHLIDDTRTYIEENYKRPLFDRMLRRTLAFVIPYPKRFALMMRLAALGRPFRGLLRGRLRAMLELAPAKLPRRDRRDLPQTYLAQSQRRYRVAILQGCAQPVLDPSIQRATVSLLTRLGCEVISAKDAGCCGALVHHMGREDEAKESAIRNINAWLALGEIDAIIINTSGCGTTVKDYGHMLRETEHAQNARKISGLAKDVTEFLVDIFPQDLPKQDITVAYHPACSLQHGQKVVEAPKALLTRAGFDVKIPFESHLCCGSAGTYNMLQPEIASALGQRKAGHIAKLNADVISAGNIGCITQIGHYVDTPIVHTVALLDWAMGGDKPF